MPGVWPNGRKETIPIESLILDPELQVREDGEADWHAGRIAEAVKAGAAMPKVQVIRIAAGEKKGDHVIDGRHTVIGHRLAGRKSVLCNVRPGTWEDAVLEAAKANRHHDALPLRPEDRRRAVRMVLAVEPHWSNKRVAAHLGCSHTYVNQIAAEVREETGKARPAEVEGQDGRKHKVPPRRPAPVSDGWRQTGLIEFLDVADFVWAAINRAGLKTAGDLYDAIRQGGLGVKAGIAEDLLHELRRLNPAVPRLEQSAPAPEPAKGKQGEIAFDWAELFDAIGKARAVLDKLGRAMPKQKDTPAYHGLSRQLEAAYDAARAMKKG